MSATIRHPGPWLLSTSGQTVKSSSRAKPYPPRRFIARMPVAFRTIAADDLEGVIGGACLRRIYPVLISFPISTFAFCVHQVMGANGVSHQIVADDLEGIKAVLTWLAFVPSRLGGALPALPTSDPADRPVTVSPAEGGLRTAQTVRSARGKSHQLAELLSFAVKQSLPSSRRGPPPLDRPRLLMCMPQASSSCPHFHVFISMSPSSSRPPDAWRRGAA